MGTAASDPALYRKLVWLNVFRVVTVTVLLGGTAALSWQSAGDGARALAPLYGVVAGTYAVSIVLSLALRRGVALRLVASGEIAADVALACVVVLLTGGLDSVFLFMFPLAIVNGAILTYRTGALAATGLALVGYAIAATFAPHAGPRPPSTLFAHGAAFVLTGVLAAYLADQLRTAGERLANITALHAAVVESMPSGLATLDGEGRVTFLNPAGAAMAGVRDEAVRGRAAAEVFPAFAQDIGRGEIEMVHRSGERKLLGYSSFPLMANGKAAGSAVIFQDLTRLRAMEDAVRRGARLADLGRVSAGLAHELRNPLASISGCVELLRTQAEAMGGDPRLMDIVLREAARLDALLTEFLLFARPPPLRPLPVDLAEVLDDTLRVFEHDPVAAGLEVQHALAPAPVACDAHQVRQVAWNLLRNAAQAQSGAARGLIRVTSAPLPGGGGEFTVEDRGPGIAPDELERIFLPFHTTKERGTGLGLATVHRIVEAHGGEVVVETPRGGGARFTVRLPARARAQDVEGA